MDMKTNKGKLMVLALTATAFLSLAGSITGTVAWYQYSTRATAGIIGSSKSVTENLQIKTDGSDWKSDLTSDDIYAAAKAKANDQNAASSITPLTSGNITKDGSLEKLYDAPQYQYGAGSYDSWHDASIKNYLQFDLYFRFTKKVNGTLSYIPREVKLTDLSITSLGPNAESGTDVLAKAMRVHFSSDSGYSLASNEGKTIDTNGQLDLNGDNKIDSSNKYQWETGENYITYGKGTQESYSASDISGNTLLANVDNKGDLKGGKTIVSTINQELTETNAASSPKVTVTIWFEGWQKLEQAKKSETDQEAKELTAMWKDDLIKDTTFRIGMQFGCDRDTNY